MDPEFTYTLQNIYTSQIPEGNANTSNSEWAEVVQTKGNYPNLFSSGAQNVFNLPFNDLLISLFQTQNSTNNIFEMFTKALDNIAKINAGCPFVSPSIFGAQQPNTSYFNYSAPKPGQISEEFYEEVKKTAKEINCDPADLLAVMYCESGLNSAAQNPSGTKATGLIQITESTAKELGTTTEELKNMTPQEQLIYVKKYLSNAKKIAKIGNDKKIDGATLYALVFLPAYAQKDILTRSGESYYNSNKSLDTNKDNVIDKQDLAKKVNQARKALGYDTVNYFS